MGANEVLKLSSSEEGEISMDLVMEVQKHPSIEEVPTFTIQSANNWMTPIISFLQDRHLPQNTEKLKRSGRGQPNLQSSMTPNTREVFPCLT